jgi:hypothetical protein
VSWPTSNQISTEYSIFSRNTEKTRGPQQFKLPPFQICTTSKRSDREASSREAETVTSTVIFALLVEPATAGVEAADTSRVPGIAASFKAARLSAITVPETVK